MGRFLSLKLAFKDLKHNRKSSLYIISVIAAICLPMIVLFSLRDGYVSLFKEWLEKTTPAKQLGINIKMGDTNKITNATIKQWNDSLDLKMVIPHIQRTGFLPRKKGSDLRMDFISTLEGNPEMKRLGMEKVGNADFGIYLPKEKKKELDIDTVNHLIKVIFDRGGRRKSINIPILGYFNSNQNDAYLSLRLMQYYEKWTNGYSINDNEMQIQLPADASRESALGDLVYDSINIFKIVGFDNRIINQIQEDERIFIAKNRTDNLFYLSCKKAIKFSDFDIETLESQFSSSYNAVAIPHVQSLRLNNLDLASSSKHDPRFQYLLERGNWISGTQSRFEVVVPATYAKSYTINDRIALKINETEVQCLVVGFHNQKNDLAYIDYETLARLKQVEQGLAKVDPIGEKFEPNEEIDYEDYPVSTAMVHVSDLEGVVPSYDFFVRQNYDIPQSSISQINHYLEIKEMLTKFVLLLTILSAIACILSLLVLMMEIIRRKSAEIGINKVIGIDEGFINRIFISQAIIYGLLGMLLSLVIFFLIRTLGESDQVNSFFGLDMEGANIFQLKLDSLLFILCLIVFVSWFAGWRSTNATKNIDPADIIIKN
ncbi:MAG: FtsX-like permease family protein [Bacteroidota bacterium]